MKQTIRLALAPLSVLFMITGCTHHVDLDSPRPYAYYLKTQRSDGTDLRLLAQGVYDYVVTDSLVLYSIWNKSLYTVRLDGTDSAAFHTEISWKDFSQAPRSGHVLLTSQAPGGVYLSLLEPDGAKLSNLCMISSGFVLFPRISPSFSRIAFTIQNGLAWVDSDGSHADTLLTFDLTDGVAVFESDSVIIYRTFDGPYEIRRLNTNTHVDQLIGLFHTDFQLRYGRYLVGTKLLFVDHDSINVLDVLSLQVSRPAQASCASFSNDGSKIIAGFQGDLFIVNVDGSQRRSLPTGSTPELGVWQPIFTPDDSHVLFMTGRLQ